MDQLVEGSASYLRALIARKAISPVELFDACRARIEALNPMVNAMVALDLERGRAAAREAEAAVIRGGPCGPLHGLPVAVKDVSATAGLRTTWGSLVYKDHVPDTDDLIVARIRAAGGIVIGKTNTPEFGAGANTINRVYGATVNPFDTALSCAGSSGGSAVALATDMVPLASGSDMGGSLRTPASFCGVVGHRPSPGLVPSRSRRHGWSALSVDGAMARTVEDLSLLLRAISGFDNHDPLATAVEHPRQLAKADLGRLRVVFSEDLGVAPVSKEVRAAFRRTTERIAPLFANVEWHDPDLGDVHTTFETLRGINFFDNYGDYVERYRELAGPNVIANVESARGITVAQVGRAMAAQTDIYRKFQVFFEDIDLLICPAAATT
ncbi:MAG: amidase, partial [Alphaproteobacteria bacterium]